MTDPRPDESDDRMFTDSFAPPAEKNAEDRDEDALDEVEDLLPEGEPIEGPAPLP